MKTERVLHRLSPTAGPGGLPLLEFYDPQVHDALLASGAHEVVEITRFMPGDRVIGQSNTSPAYTFIGRVEGDIDFINGTIAVRDENDHKVYDMRAWMVRLATDKQ
jgi:hypothetical protein